jgi:hypothetical protein
VPSSRPVTSVATSRRDKKSAATDGAKSNASVRRASIHFTRADVMVDQMNLLEEIVNRLTCANSTTRFCPEKRAGNALEAPKNSRRVRGLVTTGNGGREVQRRQRRRQATKQTGMRTDRLTLKNKRTRIARIRQQTGARQTPNQTLEGKIVGYGRGGFVTCACPQLCARC